MFENLFIWFCFIKAANFSRRFSAYSSYAVNNQNGGKACSPGISQPKYYGFVRYILKWWGFAPIWFRIQLLCASCWRYEIDLLIYFGTNCLLELRYTWHFDVHISILWRFTVLAFSDKTFSSTPLYLLGGGVVVYSISLWILADLWPATEAVWSYNEEE